MVEIFQHEIVPTKVLIIVIEHNTVKREQEYNIYYKYIPVKYFILGRSGKDIEVARTVPWIFETRERFSCVLGALVVDDRATRCSFCVSQNVAL